MLVIHPDECIDCGVCEPECPIEAIKPDSDKDAQKFLELNRDFSLRWPNITKKKPALQGADDFKTLKDKYPVHFSDQPGTGD